MIRSAKQAALRLGRSLRLFDLVGDSRWRRCRLLILAYHGISQEDEHEWDPELYMSQACFESRLEALRREGYEVLRFGDAITLLQEGKLPPRSVTLTFDDGTYDFYRCALPMLKSYGYPATVYLTTFYCQFNRPVFDLAGQYLLWKARRSPFNSRALIGEDRSYNLSVPDGRSAAWLRVKTFARRQNLTAADKDALLERLAVALGIDYDAAVKRKRLLHLMNEVEVAELVQQGVDFQLHTHGHRTPADRALFEREILDNRVRIEKWTRAVPRHFCYPSGRYSANVAAWLAEQGVVTATTCDPGLATSGTPPLMLPRFVDTMSQSELVFEGWLSGVASWLPRRRSYADGPA